MSLKRGKFITFEGIDGSGKTTQMGMVADWLERNKIPYVITREPGGTPVGEQIRGVLLRPSETGMDAYSELLLMFASRVDNLNRVIRPAVAQGKVVLCDRFTDASVAYQGYGRGIPVAFIEAIHRQVCGNEQPDLTLVIDIHPRTSVQRAREREDRAEVKEGRFEQETEAFYGRVRRGYRALGRKYRRRVKLVCGDGTIEEIHQRIVPLVEALLTGRPSRKARR
jgi:dTMP kinase